MKLRLKGAQKGHSLLKKKADALTLRFRQILSKIVEVIGAAILSALHSPIPSAQNRVHPSTRSSKSTNHNQCLFNLFLRASRSWAR